MTPILLVGGGGHCRACIDVVESTDTHRIVGIVERVGGSREAVFGYPVIGYDDALAELIQHWRVALITVGQIKSPEPRLQLFNAVRDLGGTLPVVASRSASISKHSTIGEGTVVMNGATVNAGARIGLNCIINSQALVEHDAHISSHTHISTGARINGGAAIGEGTFIGSGTVVNHGLSVGAGCIVASGSVIRSDVPAGTRVIGEWR